MNNGKKISFHFKSDYTSFWQLITLKNMELSLTNSLVMYYVSSIKSVGTGIQR